MSIRAKDLLRTDRVTGFIVPKEGALMQLATGDTVEVPPDFFVHPQTGHVLPIHGNVSYDTLTSQLIFTTDSATGKCSRLPLIGVPHSAISKCSRLCHR